MVEQLRLERLCVVRVVLSPGPGLSVADVEVRLRELLQDLGAEVAGDAGKVSVTELQENKERKQRLVRCVNHVFQR